MSFHPLHWLLTLSLLLPLHLFSNNTAGVVSASTCYAYYLTINNADLNEISREEIRNETELPVKGYPGEGHYLVASGIYKGEKVFIKFPNRTNDVNSRQERYTKILSDYGIGPKFLGIVKDGPRKRGIVTEFVQGVHVSATTDSIPNHIKISMSTYRDLLALKEKLIEMKLVNGKDVQLRLSEDGKPFLVDPEFLQFQTGNESKGTPVVVQEMDAILEVVKSNLVKRNLWQENE